MTTSPFFEPSRVESCEVLVKWVMDMAASSPTASSSSSSSSSVLVERRGAGAGLLRSIGLLILLDRFLLPDDHHHPVVSCQAPTSSRQSLVPVWQPILALPSSSPHRVMVPRRGPRRSSKVVRKPDGDDGDVQTAHPPAYKRRRLTLPQSSTLPTIHPHAPDDTVHGTTTAQFNASTCRSDSVSLPLGAEALPSSTLHQRPKRALSPLPDWLAEALDSAPARPAKKRAPFDAPPADAVLASTRRSRVEVERGGPPRDKQGMAAFVDRFRWKPSSRNFHQPSPKRPIPIDRFSSPGLPTSSSPSPPRARFVPPLPFVPVPPTHPQWPSDHIDKEAFSSSGSRLSPRHGLRGRTFSTPSVSVHHRPLGRALADAQPSSSDVQQVPLSRPLISTWSSSSVPVRPSIPPTSPLRHTRRSARTRRRRPCPRIRITRPVAFLPHIALTLSRPRPARPSSTVTPPDPDGSPPHANPAASFSPPTLSPTPSPLPPQTPSSLTSTATLSSPVIQTIPSRRRPEPSFAK